LLGRYNDLVASLVDNPELALSLYSAIGPDDDTIRKPTKEDVAVYTHLLVAYGIVEEAFLLYTKKWIGEDDWLQWSAFLERLSYHPMFSTIHRLSSGTFDKRFENYVETKILAKKSDGTPN
jgi:hypothetical protein